MATGNITNDDLLSLVELHLGSPARKVHAAFDELLNGADRHTLTGRL